MKNIAALFLSFILSGSFASPQFYSIVFYDFNQDTIPPERLGVYLGEHEYEKSSWEYSLNNSWLTVTNVWGPKATNAVFLTGGGPPVQTRADFEASAKVKWEDGKYNAVGLSVGGGYPAWGVHISYVVFYPNVEPQIRVNFGSWGGGTAAFEAPPPGEYVFTLKRVGLTAFAYIDGELIYQSSIKETYTVDGITLMFAGPKDYNDPMFKPLSVDWVYLKVFK